MHYYLDHHNGLHWIKKQTTSQVSCKLLLCAVTLLLHPMELLVTGGQTSSPNYFSQQGCHPPPNVAVGDWRTKQEAHQHLNTCTIIPWSSCVFLFLHWDCGRRVPIWMNIWLFLLDCCITKGFKGAHSASLFPIASLCCHPPPNRTDGDSRTKQEQST